MSTIFKARALCGLAYLVAIAAAAGAVLWLPIPSPWWRVAAADAIGTLVVFAFSRAFDNSSFYDPYWSVAPIAMALYWWLGVAAEGTSLWRVVCVVALVTAWGLRLTYNWLRGWRGLGHEDWRYRDFRKKTGRGYWLVSLAGLHSFPTLQVLLGCGSVYVALVLGTRGFGWLDAVAVAVTGVAIIIEAVADRQLRRFVRNNDDPQRVLDTGLWATSRHPNYFGEVLFWWGLFLFAVAADPGALWAIVGPGAITLMFLFVSIPLIDEHMLNKRAHYAEHMKRVSRLIPWFSGKAS